MEFIFPNQDYHLDGPSIFLSMNPALLRENVEFEWKIVAVGGKRRKEVVYLQKSRSNALEFRDNNIKDCKDIFIEASVKMCHGELEIEACEENPVFASVWAAKECHDFDKSMKRSNVEVDFTDPASILLDCQGTFICAKKSVLFRESTYFESRQEYIY